MIFFHDVQNCAFNLIKYYLNLITIIQGIDSFLCRVHNIKLNFINTSISNTYRDARYSGIPVISNENSYLRKSQIFRKIYDSQRLLFSFLNYCLRYSRIPGISIYIIRVCPFSCGRCYRCYDVSYNK